ncbi:transglycosylase domain-containing protein [Neorhizobium galegae]|uniref:Penicillin-binding protein, 1A family n=1 Tax=Neorhizobium galegae bv. orientalis str. HAMBI 540 TaxID=1028800 RepID=A0A068SZ78_NEOGA|nr:transglycosylase domain-containing protein [Neorhizobium galegae]CDN50445.1 Penicillin-binding protein, 1A family [Neorhizobium galegae bv. orientalis str. HAMBI 540]CDZ48798.1 Penicillin-binding protein, 1A family [Neorhizobium galegae bv. orientalis]
MAARGRSDKRVEPSFEGSRPSDDFRLDADERVVGNGNGRPGRRPSRAESDERSERPERARPSRNKKAPQRGQGGGFFAPLRRLIYWCFVLGIWAGIAVGGLVLYYGARMPAASTWAIPDRPPNMKITAVDGSVVANRGSTGGEALALEEMSPYLPQAVIAIEDRRFYSHFGVDPFGLARAVVNNLTGQPIQGGSTITQQLAKNLFLSPDRTFERKIQEVLLSFWLEHKFTKDQILAMYLNRVFFGSNAYGVEAASRRYFNKSARDVNLGEAATLAGLLKAPSRLSPARDPKAAETRAQIVLGTMREEGYVTDSDLKTAMSQPPAKAKSYWTGAQHYAADMVVDEVKSLIGEPKVDVTVETTLDMRLEAAAEKSLNDILKKEGGKLNASQAALVSVDATGAIRALVGGRDYATSQFNRAVKAKRQPGSAFKPFVYAAALEAGARPDSMVNDAPVKIGNWSPENFDEKYRGPVTLASAFAQSLNTVAAQLVMQVGPDKVVSLAHRLGIDSDIQANASIALGTSEVSLVELTSAYASFMNGGYKATPHIVKRITDPDGKVLYEADYANPPRVLSEPVAATMNGMMNRVINEGTGKAARIDGWQAAGKSGTTQSFRDALFVGYTSIMTTGIWFGNDDGAFMKKVTGGGLPAKAWKEYMTSAMKGYTPTPLFGTGRGLDLPPAAVQPDSPSTTIGDIISGILPGGRRTQEELPADYPPAPRPPVQDSASIEREPARVRPVYGDNQGYDNRDNRQIYDNRPVYGDRGRHGDVIPPGDVPARDYRQYRGPYDSPTPVPPGAIGGGPVPPGDVGVAGSRGQPRQTTLFDLIMGQ